MGREHMGACEGKWPGAMGSGGIEASATPDGEDHKEVPIIFQKIVSLFLDAFWQPLLSRKCGLKDLSYLWNKYSHLSPLFVFNGSLWGLWETQTRGRQLWVVVCCSDWKSVNTGISALSFIIASRVSKTEKWPVEMKRPHFQFSLWEWKCLPNFKWGLRSEKQDELPSRVLNAIPGGKKKKGRQSLSCFSQTPVRWVSKLMACFLCWLTHASSLTNQRPGQLTFEAFEIIHLSGWVLIFLYCTMVASIKHYFSYWPWATPTCCCLLYVFL